MTPQATTTPRPAVDPAFIALNERIADCPACGLARTRSRTVPGSGPANAQIMFIGEAPGAREDELGLPFVGRAGQFLDELLASIQMSRDTVFIANVVKCRPPANRDPQPDEMAACRPFLDEQIATIDPRVIVTLGRFSMQRWFAGSAISRIHGQPRRIEGSRIVIPMYHPAAALRNGSLRAVVLEDFARIPALLDEAHAAVESTAAAEPTAPPEAGLVTQRLAL